MRVTKGSDQQNLGHKRACCVQIPIKSRALYIPKFWVGCWRRPSGWRIRHVGGCTWARMYKPDVRVSSHLFSGGEGGLLLTFSTDQSLDWWEGRRVTFVLASDIKIYITKYSIESRNISTQKTTGAGLMYYAKMLLHPRHLAHSRHGGCRHPCTSNNTCEIKCWSRQT